MARARGCDLRAVLAGAIICWAAAEGVAVGQEGAEATEDLGNSYVLARRTTGQGSIIETLLFAGQAIVTEIAVPAGSDGSVTAGTTGAATVAPPDPANAARGDAANLPLGIGPRFGGTLLTGEMVDDYLVLHRTRASSPVTHEIFHDGHKVGVVTEVDSPDRVRRSLGRNSFAFESTDDRFVVHLTQPDGTRIHATTVHGRFSRQVIERVAAIGAPPRSALTVMPSRPLESVKPSMGRSPEPQRLAIPQEPAGRIMVEDPTPQVVPALPEQVPLPRAFPKLRLRPAIAGTPVQTASPSPPGNYRSVPAPTIAAPAARPKPEAASVSAPPPATTKPVASAPTAVAPAARPKPAAASVSARPPAATVGARPVASAPTPAAPAARPKPAVATPEPSAAMAAKPIAPASTTAASAAKPKSTTTTASARPSPAVATKPATPVAKPSRSPPSSQ